MAFASHTSLWWCAICNMIVQWQNFILMLEVSSVFAYHLDSSTLLVMFLSTLWQVEGSKLDGGERERFGPQITKETNILMMEQTSLFNLSLLLI